MPFGHLRPRAQARRRTGLYRAAIHVGKALKRAAPRDRAAVLSKASSGQARVSAHSGRDPLRGGRRTASATRERRPRRDRRLTITRHLGAKRHADTDGCRPINFASRALAPRRRPVPSAATDIGASYAGLHCSRSLGLCGDSRRVAMAHPSRARTHPAETMCDDAVAAAFEATRLKRPGPPLRSGLAPRRGAPLRPGASVDAVGFARTPAGNGPAPGN